LSLSKHRKWFALGFFILVSAIAVRHYLLGGGPTGSPEVCAYCPMGAIASLYVFVVHGQFLRHIHPTSIVVLAAVILVTFLSRRAFCGWICPFGTLQEWLARLGRKVIGRVTEPPAWLDRRLRYLKYGVLAIVVGASWYIGTLVLRRYDPYLAAFDFGASLNELWPGYAMLGIVVLGSLFVERFWCRYACPLGALLGILSKAGIMKIAHEEGTCKNCKAGIQRCPMGINPTLETDLRSAECIQCMECVAVCPIHNAVRVEAFGRRMRPALIGVSIAGAFLLVIVAAQYLGAWQTLHGRQRGSSIWNDAGVEESMMVTGTMTLDAVRRMYGMEEPELRRILGLRAGIPMDRSIFELRQADPAAVPPPDEIELILSRNREGVSLGVQSAEEDRSLATGGRSSRSSARRGGGAGRAASASSATLRGSTSLRDALEYSGKTLKQVKEDWGLSFVDPQTNLGTLARTIGIPMRELRAYFER